ncbi:hypothetical protein ABI59_04310 [Acidobacteria bacterium Mor1]|nr:hypothetical protein ABI59_04310 [Acidobacteria bacterium Mor1]
MDRLINILQIVGAFLVMLGPLIVIHEFGHFIVAKGLRIGVPVFSVGLGPRLFGFRRGGTDYRISAIPLGGYVRLKGDEADEHRSGAPDEFLMRPRWQRFLVFVAGAAFNIALALFLTWLVFWIYGVNEIPSADTYPVVQNLERGGPAEVAGVQVGDSVISVGGSDLRGDPDQVLLNQIMLRPEQMVSVVVERDGEQLTLPLQVGADERSSLGVAGWLVRLVSTEPSHGRVVEVLDGAARRAGVQEGDLIVGADDMRPLTELELRQLLASSPGREVMLHLERDGSELSLAVVPEEQDGQGFIGVSLQPSNLVHRSFSAGEAFSQAVTVNIDLSQTLFRTLKALVGGQIGVKALSGPIEIAQVSRRAVQSGMQTALWFMAFISLQLGILNLLPIPVLDGGHILILAVEGVMRRELSIAIKERVMQVGLLFLLVFFVVVLYLDATKAGLGF